MANLIDLRAERAMRQSDLEAAHRLAAQSREVNGPDHPINADYDAWITNRTEALDAATAALAAAAVAVLLDRTWTARRAHAPIT